jgi:hypothetical protein
VIIAIAVICSALAIAGCALAWWHRVDTRARHEFEESERAWQRSHGGQLTAIRESGRHRR